MKSIVELSEVEEITLQQLSINHRHRDTRTRAAGLLLLDRKVMPKVIAEQLGVSDQSVYNWLHAWCNGVCALMGGHSGGRPRALPEAMIAMALEVLGPNRWPLHRLRNACRTFRVSPCHAALKRSAKRLSAQASLSNAIATRLKKA